jgi:ABC-type multidrug transport system fused ATPase/permease subunit
VKTFPRPAVPIPAVASARGYLLWLARENAATIALGAAAGIVCLLAQALMPAAVGAAVDAGLTARDSAALAGWGAVVLGLGVVQAVGSILRDRVTLTTSLGARFRTIQLVTRKTSELGAALSRRIAHGEVVSVGLADVAQIGRALESTAQGAGAVVAVVVTAVILLRASWLLGLVVLVGVPAMAAAVGLVVRTIQRRQGKLRERQSGVAEQAVDIVTGLRVLRGIGGEPVLARRYREESQQARQAGVTVARTEGVLTGAQILLPGLLVAVVVWVGARMAFAGTISAGELVAFYAYAAFLATPLRRLTNAADDITRGGVAAGRLVRLLGMDDGLVSVAEAREPADWRQPLADPESGVTLRPGTHTGVVCVDAGDAEVIADRLGRYAESDASIGPVRLADLPVPEVRRHLLVVRNDDSLFSGPLRTVLDPAGEATDALLAEMLRAASAADVVNAAPGGLDHVVAGAGRQFSGGQQQRLRLTRALVAGPDVLILVDPTSAVDAHTEARIADGLRTVRAGRTTAVFTTSPLVLNTTDRVLLVAAGRVVAEGTPHELLADERYRAVVSRDAEDVA